VGASVYYSNKNYKCTTTTTALSDQLESYQKEHYKLFAAAKSKECSMFINYQLANL